MLPMPMMATVLPEMLFVIRLSSRFGCARS
jgi:hypothetical protein